MQNTTNKRRERALRILTYAFFLIHIALQYAQLQYSAYPGKSYFFMQHPQMLAVNYALLLVLNLLLLTLVDRAGISMLIASLLCSLWSIADYYVILYHGSPLFFSEFASFRTAMNVASGYNFAIDREAGRLLILGGLELAVAVLGLMIEGKIKRPRSLRRAGWRFGSFVILGAIVLAALNNTAIKPRSAMAWTWYEGVRDYGYPSCIYEDVEKRLHAVIKPEGYSTEAVNAISLREPGGSHTERPDIILILNETFYDLSVYADPEPDWDYLAPFYSLDNAVYGRAIVPTIGGGTNNTEYELLVSNAFYLMQIYAPFNYINLSKPPMGVVSYLKDFGYSSAGMHCGGKTNYARNRAYPELGFDTVVLGTEPFVIQNYGHRIRLDAGVYRSLIEQYESMEEGPRFLYLLTYQNHGDYEKNDPELDTVHTRRDFGDLTDDIDEYMSSISLSAQAFAELTAYFETVDRPTIVCMLGDHAPMFINQLESDEALTEYEEQIVKRMVPYVVWANFDLGFAEKHDLVSVTDLMPMILEAAGFPLSTYYQTLLQLHEALPVRTSNGLCMDADGNYSEFDWTDDTPSAALLRQYYYMEYNLLKGGSNYRAELFHLEK